MPPRFKPPLIDRYIVSQLCVALALVTVGLLALIWLTQSLRFIQIVVDHGLSPFVFIKLTALLIPSFLAVILPITCFIVVLFTYARLGGDRELTIMRGIGLSNVRLARPALIVAGAATILGYALNLVVVPSTLKDFHDYQFEIRNQVAAFLLQPGVFTHVSDGITVYVQGRSQDGTLSDILIEDSRDPAAPATLLAGSGQIVYNPSGPLVVLVNGSREVIDPHTGRLDMLTFARNEVSLAQATHAGSDEYLDASEVPLSYLFHPDWRVSPENRGKWAVEAERRLSSPLASLTYTLIALVGVLGGVFRRHGGLVRPVGAVAGVTALVALTLGVDNLAARDTVLLPLIWLVTLLPLVGVFVLLGRQKLARA